MCFYHHVGIPLREICVYIGNLFDKIAVVVVGHINLRLNILPNHYNIPRGKYKVFTRLFANFACAKFKQTPFI